MRIQTASVMIGIRTASCIYLHSAPELHATACAIPSFIVLCMPCVLAWNPQRLLTRTAGKQSDVHVNRDCGLARPCMPRYTSEMPPIPNQPLTAPYMRAVVDPTGCEHEKYAQLRLGHTLARHDEYKSPIAHHCRYMLVQTVLSFPVLSF